MIKREKEDPKATSLRYLLEPGRSSPPAGLESLLSLREVVLSLRTFTQPTWCAPPQKLLG